MKSFLEFVCHELLGPRACGSSWFCPFCEHKREKKWASLSVRPPKGTLPIKWACHLCKAWGDEFDLVKRLFPAMSHAAVELYLTKMLERYVHEHRDKSPLGETGGANARLLPPAVAKQASKLAANLNRSSFSPNGDGEGT